MCQSQHASILYLMLAQGCNAECGYCPIPAMARKYGERMLSLDDAVAGVDLWVRHMENEVGVVPPYSVMFYGGEPLLNPSPIEDVILYVKHQQSQGRIKKEVSFFLPTNGTLLDDSLLACLKEYGVLVVVGIDGPQETHDKLRVMPDGAGTYFQAVEAVRKLVEHEIRTFASVTLTPETLPHALNIGSSLKKMGIEKFSFNLLRGKALLKLSPAERGSYYNEAARVVIENFRNQRTWDYEYQMERKVAAFVGGYRPVDCTCYGNQIVVQPDGQLSHCPFNKPNLGYVQTLPPTFRIWDTPVVQEWRKRIPQGETSGDRILYGGGCAWGVQDFCGDVSQDDQGALTLAQEVWRELARE